MPLNPLDLTGRTVIVTGASSGIGRETAMLLSQLNARLLVVGRDPARLQATLGSLEGCGHCAEVFDLQSLDAIPQWLKGMAAKMGPFHGLAHSAGAYGAIPLRALSAAKAEDLFRINVTAGLMLAKAFRQKDCRAADASIVLIASVAGLAGEAALSAYSASKAAVIGLTRALAMELARERIRVNCVAPGLVRTEMAGRLEDTIGPERAAAVEALHPLGLGQPRDVANSIAFLLADTARWITGATLTVDGGYTAH